MKTIDYIDRLKAKAKIPSDYALEKHLQLAKGTVTHYRSSRRIMDDYVAARIADELDVPHMEVISAAQAEREQDSARKRYWLTMHKKFLATAGTVLGALTVAVLTIGGSDLSEAFLAFGLVAAAPQSVLSGFGIHIVAFSVGYGAGQRLGFLRPILAILGKLRFGAPLIIFLAVGTGGALLLGLFAALLLFLRLVLGDGLIH